MKHSLRSREAKRAVRFIRTKKEHLQLQVLFFGAGGDTELFGKPRNINGFWAFGQHFFLQSLHKIISFKATAEKTVAFFIPILLYQYVWKINLFFVCTPQNKVGSDVFLAKISEGIQNDFSPKNNTFILGGSLDHLNLNGKIQSCFSCPGKT